MTLNINPITVPEPDISEPISSLIASLESMVGWSFARGNSGTLVSYIFTHKDCELYISGYNCSDGSLKWFCWQVGFTNDEKYAVARIAGGILDKHRSEIRIKNTIDSRAKYNVFQLNKGN